MNDFVIVYFSKDRPMQLDLAMRTNLWHGEGNADCKVIYKASNERYQNAYETLQSTHHYASFIKEEHFKNDLLNALKGYRFVEFVVDDCIFTHDYSIETIKDRLMAQPDVIGFSLRLGLNTTECYPLKIKNEIPKQVWEDEYGETIEFSWVQAGRGDFSYPMEVSSSVYRISDIELPLKFGYFTSPNQLETILDFSKYSLMHKKPMLACYKTSVAFCNPINKVQKENNNRAGTNIWYTPEALLKAFENGGRIKLFDFDKFVSNGCHQEVEVEFYEHR